MAFTYEQRKVWARERRAKRLAQAKEMLGGKCVSCGSTGELWFITKPGEVSSFRLGGEPQAYYATDLVFFAEVQKKELWCRTCYDQSRIVHGSEHRYNKGCRCELCREARHQEWLADKAAGKHLIRNQRRNQKAAVERGPKVIKPQVVYYEEREHAR